MALMHDYQLISRDIFYRLGYFQVEVSVKLQTRLMHGLLQFCPLKCNVFLLSSISGKAGFRAEIVQFQTFGLAGVQPMFSYASNGIIVFIHIT